jgi:hypothetical protein
MSPNAIEGHLTKYSTKKIDFKNVRIFRTELLLGRWIQKADFGFFVCKDSFHSSILDLCVRNPSQLP